jgi:hypothetical protein
VKEVRGRVGHGVDGRVKVAAAAPEADERVPTEPEEGGGSGSDELTERVGPGCGDGRWGVSARWGRGGGGGERDGAWP